MDKEIVAAIIAGVATIVAAGIALVKRKPGYRLVNFESLHLINVEGGMYNKAKFV